MNKRMSLSLIGGMVACAAALGAGVVAQGYMDTEYVPAEAAGTTLLTDSETLRFKIEIQWPNDFPNGNCYVYLWSGSVKSGDFNDISSPIINGEADFSIPYYPYENIIVHNGNGNQTGNLVFPELSRKIGNYVPVGNLGGWNSLTWTYQVVEPVIGEDNLRVWVNRNSHYDEQGYSYVFHFWGNGVDEEYLPTGYVDVSGGTYFPYFDLPKDVVGNNWQLKIYNDTSYSFEAASSEYVYNAGDNAKVFRFDYPAVSLTDLDGELKDEAVPTVLEPYLTCSSDLDNGHGSVETLLDTWFGISDFTDQSSIEALQNRLSSIEINDFDSMDTSYSGGQISKTSAWDKINRMFVENLLNSNTQANGLSAFFSSEDGSNAVMAGGIAVIAVGIAAAAAMLVRSRRQGKSR